MRRPHPIRWLRENPRRADLMLAVLVTAFAVAAHFFESDGNDPDALDPTWWSPFVVAATAFPIYWRRTYPLRSGTFVVAAQCIALFIGIEGAAFLGSTIAVYSIGAHASGPHRTRVLVAIAGMIAALFVAGWIDGQDLLSEFIGTVVILVTAFVLGDNMRRRRDHLVALAERAERAEREKDLLADQRVRAERTRIARELHDVVAHSVSVMVIQAAAARRSLDASTERAEAALLAIEESGRQTMNELRSILGVLREADDAGPERSPQPTLADIDALLGRDEDLPVDLVVVEPIGELPHSVMLTGYRVVQEALTNVRRHAGPVDRVEVRVEREDERLSIAVTDDGRGAAADQVEPGYGLVGMRERIGAMGGDIDVGPRVGGGWQVRISIPVEQPATRARETTS